MANTNNFLTISYVTTSLFWGSQTATIIDIPFYFSASGAGQGSIDNRIEQAMVSNILFVSVA